MYESKSLLDIGLLVGDAVGEFDGLNVGEIDGDAVGESNGENVGLLIGLDDGT